MIVFDSMVNVVFAALCVFELAFIGFNVATLIGLVTTSTTFLWAMSILVRAELIFARGGKRVVMNFFLYSW
jgi:hypothetical protein